MGARGRSNTRACHRPRRFPPFTVGRAWTQNSPGASRTRMDDPNRQDSATALARTPLFSQLGRLDLARLAGELEELTFAKGDAIVRQGDPPDGFYVINSGRV